MTGEHRAGLGATIHRPSGKPGCTYARLNAIAKRPNASSQRQYTCRRFEGDTRSIAEVNWIRSSSGSSFLVPNLWALHEPRGRTRHTRRPSPECIILWLLGILNRETHCVNKAAPAPSEQFRKLNTLVLTTV